MCEFQIYKEEIPYCEYTKSACTLCVFGNKETYNKAILTKEQQYMKQVFIERTIPIKCDFCPYSFLDEQGILKCESDGCKLEVEVIGDMAKMKENKKNE